jgi:peptidyl-prolyl cis-trans isomerase C
MSKNRSLPGVAAGWLLSILGLIALAGCSRPSPAVTSEPASPTSPPPAATATPLPPTPTATPEPLAALVNGEGITQADYQAELARFQAAVGTQLATEDQQRVLNDLIDELLLAQAARQAGFVVDDAMVQKHMDTLIASRGSAQALAGWLAKNGYTELSFRRSLERSIAAAWMRDQIINAVPAAVEQVHARQILRFTADEANQVLARLQKGDDFVTLAAAYDPVTRGDLGWFPRGYLLDTQLDEAAFSLQPGEYSAVIHTSAGYHILQIIERDPQHPLDYNARQALQTQALESWIQTHRSQSEIQVSVH